jgi:hypothetical protein
VFGELTILCNQNTSCGFIFGAAESSTNSWTKTRKARAANFMRKLDAFHWATSSASSVQKFASYLQFVSGMRWLFLVVYIMLIRQ